MVSVSVPFWARSGPKAGEPGWGEGLRLTPTFGVFHWTKTRVVTAWTGAGQLY